MSQPALHREAARAGAAPSGSGFGPMVHWTGLGVPGLPIVERACAAPSLGQLVSFFRREPPSVCFSGTESSVLPLDLCWLVQLPL